MAQGICKITKGWVIQDSALVRYDPKGTTHEIPEDEYRREGYQPRFDDLPECKGEQNA